MKYILPINSLFPDIIILKTKTETKLAKIHIIVSQ